MKIIPIKKDSLSSLNSASSHKEIDGRQAYAIKMYNYVSGRDIPVNVKGMEFLGGINAIIKEIANDPRLFYKFINAQKYTSPSKIITDILVSVSRNAK